MSPVMNTAPCLVMQLAVTVFELIHILDTNGPQAKPQILSSSLLHNQDLGSVTNLLLALGVPSWILPTLRAHESQGIKGLKPGPSRRSPKSHRFIQCWFYFPFYQVSAGCMCPVPAKLEAEEHGTEPHEPNTTQKLQYKGQFKERTQTHHVPFISI